MDDEDSPKNEFSALENEFEGFGTQNSDFVDNQELNPNSRPGSFLDPSQSLTAEQEYRSNGDEEEYVDDVNIEVNYDQSPGQDEPIEATPTNPLAHLQPIKNEPEYLKEVNLRRDPEEEYFMLAVLAHKMIHTEEYEAEYIYDIDT